MGSFHISCSVSGLNIEHGDEVVLFILDKREFTKKDIVLDYIIDLYEPIYLPLFGKYDEYGGLYDIEENENTKIIENEVNSSIQDFVEKIIDNNNKYHFMFVNRHIYNSLLSFSINENESPSNLKNIDFIVPSIFKKLGFELVKYEDKTYFYKKENKTIEFSTFSFKINDKEFIVHNIRDFIEKWEKETGEKLDLNLLKNVDIFYEEAKKRLYETKNGLRNLERFVSKDFSGLSNMFLKYENFIKDNDKLLHELADSVRFSWALREINSIYKPSIVGLNENESLKILYKKALLLLEENDEPREDF